MIFTVEEPAFSCFDFRTLLKRGRGAINAACLKGPGLREDVQPSQLCHSERRRSFACEWSSQSRNLLFLPSLQHFTCAKQTRQTLLKYGRATYGGVFRRNCASALCPNAPHWAS